MAWKRKLRVVIEFMCDGHHVWTMTWKEKVKNCYSVFVADGIQPV